LDLTFASRTRGKTDANVKSTALVSRVLTFVSYRGELVYECQNQWDTSKYRFSSE
jgi:hypothetical protein